MALKKEPGVELSSGLKAAIEAWIEANCPFPQSFLEELKLALEARGFRNAANSLHPDRRGLVIKYDPKCRFRLFQEWAIESGGPSRARTFIYDFTRRKKCGHFTYMQPIRMPLPGMVEIRGLNTDPDLEWRYRVDYFYCLPEEVAQIRRKLRSDIAEDVRTKVRRAMEPFANTKRIRAASR